MRIPFPERVPIDRVAIFVVALFAIQMLEQTALFFSVGCAVFILIAAFAFNSAGGLSRASGAYIFSYAVLVVIIGICYKAFLGEPGQSNLQSPRTTIEAYVATISMMYAAVIVSRRLTRKTGLLQNLLKETEMHRASVGCIAFGIAGGSIIALLGQGGTGLETSFDQLNQLVPLGIIIGVMNEIRRSGGTRSTNLPIIAGAAYVFVFGIIGFSKQGMLLPLYCWILPVCALRFRLSAWQVLGGVLGVFIIFHYLVPFSQYGRNLVPENATLRQRIAIAEPLLEHPEQTRQLYSEGVTELEASGEFGGYYNSAQGFWDRLQFVATDDSLISYTEQGHVFGLLPIKASFLNAVPHFLWPDKPNVNFGNVYAHEMGGLAENDSTTGISFSPTAEAYHIAEWKGILFIAPLLWLLLFVVFDSLFGDIRATPWGLLAMAQISHIAPEGGLSSIIHLLTTGSVVFIFCALFATWVAPILAIPILGPGRKRDAHPIDLGLASNIP